MPRVKDAQGNVVVISDGAKIYGISRENMRQINYAAVKQAIIDGKLDNLAEKNPMIASWWRD